MRDPSELPAAARALYEEIVAAPTQRRTELVRALERLRQASSLPWALQALFRQQVRSGYVLFDPASAVEERIIPDPALGVALRLQWNPQRELRKRHDLLVARGVIADVDPQRLVNRDARGHGCYLCEANIALQNPGELCWPIELGGEDYLLGANFVPIADNHFTVMSRIHRPQRYHPGLLAAALDLAERGEGLLRVLFNGRAGASIEEHEHLHATDESLPVEALPLAGAPELRRYAGARLLAPAWYLPLYVVEGEDRRAVIELADRLLRDWHDRDPQRHTENLLISRVDGRDRVYLFLRDRNRLNAPGRRGALGSFEMAGRLVLSDPDDRGLFETAGLQTVRGLLSAAAPERPAPL